VVFVKEEGLGPDAPQEPWAQARITELPVDKYGAAMLSGHEISDTADEIAQYELPTKSSRPESSSNEINEVQATPVARRVEIYVDDAIKVLENGAKDFQFNGNIMGEGEGEAGSEESTKQYSNVKAESGPSQLDLLEQQIQRVRAKEQRISKLQ
jgi:hypothetical protein